MHARKETNPKKIPGSCSQWGTVPGGSSPQQAKISLICLYSPPDDGPPSWKIEFLSDKRRLGSLDWFESMDSEEALNGCIEVSVDDDGHHHLNGYIGGKEASSSFHNNVSSATSVLRKKSDPMLVTNLRFRMLRRVLTNLQEVILGTKLAVLFPAIPLAIVAEIYRLGRVSQSFD